MTMSILENRSSVFQYLLDRGVSAEDAAESILTQRDHSEFDRFLFEHNRRRALVDQFAQGIVDSHQLVNSCAAFVAGVFTNVAAFPVEKFSIADVALGNFKL